MTELEMARLVLGTAQLGMPYGAANKTGRPDRDTARAIVAEALAQGVRVFDTARGYGESEAVLGDALEHLGAADRVKVITKLPPRLERLDPQVLNAEIRASLEALRTPALFGLLLHRENQLGLLAGLARERTADGRPDARLGHMGISVYAPGMALAALEHDLVDMVQIPANIFDARPRREGVAALAARRGKTLVLRSVLLQGVAIMDAQALPSRLAFAAPYIARFEVLAREMGLSRLELAFAYVRQAYPEALVLFGAERPEQVAQCAQAWRAPVSSEAVARVEAAFPDVPLTLVDPSRWPQEGA